MRDDRKACVYRTTRRNAFYTAFFSAPCESTAGATLTVATSSWLCPGGAERRRAPADTSSTTFVKLAVEPADSEASQGVSISRAKSFSQLEQPTLADKLSSWVSDGATN